MNESIYSPNYHFEKNLLLDTESTHLTLDETESAALTPEYEQLLATYQRIKHERDMLYKAFRMFSQPTAPFD